MTKAAWCLACQEIFSPPRDETWRFCSPPCGHTGVRWRDGRTGQLEVSSLHGPDGMRVLGFNNTFMRLAVAPEYRPDSWERWRELHAASTKKVEPHYLFHDDRRACWALIVRCGESGDIHAMPYSEASAAYRAATGRDPQ